LRWRKVTSGAKAPGFFASYLHEWNSCPARDIFLFRRLKPLRNKALDAALKGRSSTTQVEAGEADFFFRRIEHDLTTPGPSRDYFATFELVPFPLQFPQTEEPFPVELVLSQNALRRTESVTLAGCAPYNGFRVSGTPYKVSCPPTAVETCGMCPTSRS
jgi:hypothetical protein